MARLSFVNSAVIIGSCTSLLLPATVTAQLDRLSHVSQQATTSCSFEPGQSVNTSSGLVHGHRAQNVTTVSEYLGIPYAEPPIGTRRFAVPVRYTARGDINGSAYGYTCVQPRQQIPAAVLEPNIYNLFYNQSLSGVQHSEDCLTLNIWTKPQFDTIRKPVLLWIHGGSFQTGGSNSSVNNGKYIADSADVVYVNINYRLNVFGFPGSPGIPANLGLLDQRLAVEWVRDNIVGFGGDPDKIIIIGDSAGSAAVDVYNYAWLDDPIIAGSIMESGDSSLTSLQAEPQAAAWYNVTNTLGCGTNETSSDADIVRCMQHSNLTAELIFNATIGLPPSSSVLTASFNPTIDNQIVFANYTQRGLEGKIVKKPVLMGINDFEGGLFKFLALAMGENQPNVFYDGLTQSVFTCPSNTAAYVRKVNKIPVWRYRYFGMFPNLEINLRPSNNDTVGISVNNGRAYHSSEIPTLLGTSEEASQMDSTWQQRELGNYMRNAWAAFAHDPDSGLDSVLGWPQYEINANATGLVLLGANNGTGATFVARGFYDDDPLPGRCTLPGAVS